MTYTPQIVMNEDAFSKLAAFPYAFDKHKSTHIFKWKFIDNDDTLKILEFKCGYVILRQSTYYTEELCLYDVFRKHFERILDVNEFIEKNISLFEKTKIVYASAKEVVDKLSQQGALGPNSFFGGDEYGWCIKAPKMHLKVFVHLYSDPSKKNIKLEYKNPSSGKGKSGLVDKKQLYSFLKKNIVVIKELPPVIEEQVEGITEQLEQLSCETAVEEHTTPKTTVSSVPYHMMTKEEKEKLRNHSKLFIPKDKRIAYQTCKPIRGKFDYLLDEMK